MKKLKKAQSITEYGILIAIIIAAAVGMQTYVKRGINAKVKDGTDLLTSVDSDDVTGSGQALGSTQQYEPYYSSSYSKVTTTKEESERAVNDGGEAKATSYRDYDVGSTEVTEGVQ